MLPQFSFQLAMALVLNDVKNLRIIIEKSIATYFNSRVRGGNGSVQTFLFPTD